MVRGAMGFSILGKSLAKGLKGLSRFIFYNKYNFLTWFIFRKYEIIPRKTINFHS
jgi:hypothetical protein